MKLMVKRKLMNTENKLTDKNNYAFSTLLPPKRLFQACLARWYPFTPACLALPLAEPIPAPPLAIPDILVLHYQNHY